MNLHNLSFKVFTLEDIKASVGFLNIAEVFSAEYKDLPPA
jgi:hypothetical protein